MRRAQFTQSHTYHAYYHGFDLLSFYPCLCISINLFSEGNFILKAKVHNLKGRKNCSQNTLTFCLCVKTSDLLRYQSSTKYTNYSLYSQAVQMVMYYTSFVSVQNMKYKSFKMYLNWVIEFIGLFWRPIVIQYEFIAY